METIRPHPDRGGWTLARALIAGEFRIDARDGPGWKSIGDILPFVLATMATMAKNDESPTRPDERPRRAFENLRRDATGETKDVQ